ncbi:hypothetical protein ACFPER_11440 [Agromyces aurantiacus]|uniref:Uncharacterized protein n=1 Tax=Agromyces aurantiacus TaxID=165814 RepID=A0ABV9RB62_9MICO|nr:hypothetical protein [Agromyces aurantiacus]MBM7504092.1 hypothetical protein [Agromyces aurantiacus]
MRSPDAAEPDAAEPDGVEAVEAEVADPPRPEPGPAPAHAPRPPRRLGTGAAVIAIAGVIATALAGHQLAASVAHAEVWPAWATADARFDDASTSYTATADRGESAVARAENLLATATGELVRDEDRAALEERIASARAILDDPPEGPAGLADLGEPGSPAPAWERYADLWRLTELIPSRNQAAARFDDAADEVANGTVAVSTAMEELLAGTEELVGQALEASPSASYAARVAVQDALDGIRHSPTVSSGDADRFAQLTAAVAEVRASHAAEEEHRRAYPVRADIEAFARSIAAGVELDFVWAWEVAGLSSDAWYSGTAEFKPEGDGWGLISLTESIEREWSTDENAEAVVVHEVGHTQVLRDECYAIFAAEPFAGDHETWATAWAIGMGYDLPGSGIEAYGRPTDAQIDAAKACR